MTRTIVVAAMMFAAGLALGIHISPPGTVDVADGASLQGPITIQNAVVRVNGDDASISGVHTLGYPWWRSTP